MKSSSVLRFCASILFIFAAFFTISAQTDQELGEAAVKAIKLFQAERYVEAIPHFELVIKAIPDQENVRFMYGWCLLAKSKQISDTNEAKQLSAADREAVAEELLVSITDEDQATIDAAWAAEAQRRAEAVARGEMKTIPGDQAMREAYESLRQVRRK